MHFRVAVQAGTTLGEVGGAFTEPVRVRRGIPRDLRAFDLRDKGSVRGVALMAKEGSPHLQHAFDNGAVRVVAIRAILADRLVVMHEGAALLSMALVTGFDHRVALHQLRAGRAMRIMAIRAGNLAFQDGVMRGTVYLGALLLVAGEADFELGCLAEDFIFRDMHRVAVGAADIATLVGASRPVRSIRITLVTSDARSNLAFGTRAALGLENHIRPWTVGDTFRFVDVPVAISVAAGACRRAPVSHRAVFCLADVQDLGYIAFIMALRALGVIAENQILLGLCAVGGLGN